MRHGADPRENRATYCLIYIYWSFAMHRRRYFLLPDKEHTRSVVDELTREGISIRNMHTHGARSHRWTGWRVELKSHFSG